MSAASLVERVACPTDRRVSYARLTAAGRAALDEALPVHTASLREAAAGFSDAERRTFDALLDRLLPDVRATDVPEQGT